MEYRPRRKRIVYTSPTNKIKAVERVINDGISTRLIAEEYAVSLTSIQLWVKQYKDFGPDFFSVKEEVVPNDNSSLKAELDRLKQIEKAYEEKLIEVEILKKFQAFLKTK